MRLMTILSWSALLVLLVITVVLGLAPVFFDTEPWTFGLYQPSLWYAVPGLLIMIKRPWHQVGWLLILIGLSFALTSLPVTPDRLGPSWHPWFTWACGAFGGYFGFMVVAILLVVFPDGLSQRSRRDMRLGRVVIGAMATLTIAAALTDPVVAEGSDGTATFPNPLGVHLLPRALADYGYAAVFAILIGCVVWLWRRQRREQGEERRRYTVVLYAFSLLIVALVFGITMTAMIGDVAWLGALVGWFLVPAAFAYAVIRQGLYGVDRLVRRTVSYGLVAIVVAFVYIVPVLLLPRILGESSDLVIAASTLAAAAVFNPVRRRIQTLVDHRFDRARYDAEREVAALSSRLENAVDIATVSRELSGVIERTLSPTIEAIWIAPDRNVSGTEAV